MWRFFIIVFVSICCPSSGAAETIGMVATYEKCIECHEKHHPQVVAGWRRSGHARGKTVVDCISCHGNDHESASMLAIRLGEACQGCHGGKKGPVTHSYLNSKHGVIATLEANDDQWRQPLADANVRSPTCPYCHLHRGEHDVNRSLPAWNPLAPPASAERERITDVRQEPCLDCHSPRFVTTWFKSGERMVEIGRMKVREARGIVQMVRKAVDGEDDTLSGLYETMSGHHLKNVWLGVHHQSPDYQWWHGHPALDGDLLRIKGRYGDRLRQRDR